MRNINTMSISTNWTLPIIESNTTAITNLGLNSPLNGLYLAANSFIASTFGPFDQLSDYLVDVFNADDPLQYFGDTWDTIADVEIALLVCLSVGLLYIFLMIISGFVFLCCRCCCYGCGHTDYQSEKSAKSCWKYVNSSILLSILISVFICMIFLFLENDWVNEIVASLTEDVTTVFSNLSLYISGVANQVNYYTYEFDSLGEETIKYIEGLSSLIIAPLVANLTNEIQPILNDIKNVDNQLGNLVIEMNVFDTELENLRGFILL